VVGCDNRSDSWSTPPKQQPRRRTARGASVEHVPMPDPLTTNICFGGPDLRTAYVTLSGSGRLVATAWPRPGLKLHYS
jgi:sugar lactone lactonase YvrE